MGAAIEMPESVERDLMRLRQYFPYRNVWCATKDGQWEVGATLTKRVPNDLARKGWQVFKVTGTK